MQRRTMFRAGSPLVQSRVHGQFLLSGAANGRRSKTSAGTAPVDQGSAMAGGLGGEELLGAVRPRTKPVAAVIGSGGEALSRANFA